jgi:NAD(P)-dependent dehydrogenase (short-subunit alcohol dehydrogenase family)
LILGSRDEKRGDEALGLLTSKEPKWSDRLMMLAIDVSNDESVTMAAETVASSFETEAKPLYGIINNAGIGSSSIGLEPTLQVNTWGIHRVCEAFIPLLEASGRIVNVTSAAGPNFVEAADDVTRTMLTDPDVQWDAVEEYMNRCISESKDSASTTSGLGNAYGLSKACANALTLILARENPGLTINACTPGFIETDMTRPFAESQGKSASEMGMKTPEQGSSASVFLMMGEVPGSGMYFGSDCLRSPLDRYRSPGDPPYEGD